MSQGKRPGNATYSGGQSSQISPLFAQTPTTRTAGLSWSASRSNSVSGTRSGLVTVKDDKRRRRSSSPDVLAQLTQDDTTPRVQIRRDQEEEATGDGYRLKHRPDYGGFHSWHGYMNSPEEKHDDVASYAKEHRAKSERPGEGRLSNDYDRERLARSERSGEGRAAQAASGRHNGRQSSELAANTDVHTSSSRRYPDHQKGPEQQQFKFCPYTAVAEIDNERYQSGGIGYPEHHREDRHCAVVHKEFYIYAVFDGHDGSKASEFVNGRFPVVLVRRLKKLKVYTEKEIQDALVLAFRDIEQSFFVWLDPSIAEKVRLQSMIPEDMKSYDAYQQFPDVVGDLSAVSEELAGGTTAAVAVIHQDLLYIANVGDSRVLLAYCDTKEGSPPLYCKQLTVDHDCDNKEELKRLEKLGLNAKAIVRSGRIGSQQCTRTLGDYSVKAGYKEFDILSSAKSEPVIAEPFVSPGIRLSDQHQFVAIMSDGVYKTYIEATDDTEGANNAICRMIYSELREKHNGFRDVAKIVLGNLVALHRNSYEKDGRQQCRKRDDMTLVVRDLQGQSSIV